MKAELLERMSLKDLAALNGLNPVLDDLVRRLTINDPEAFVDSVEADVEKIIRGLEQDAKVREKDTEDRLTTEIIQCLTHMGYVATRDEMYNGHSDVVVRWKRDEFVWLAEAKIHSGYDYLWEGFLQLTTRYSSGTPACNRGGMIVYIRNLDATAVMTTWNSELNRRAFDDGTAVQSNPDVENPMRLRSTHSHKKSGQPYRVRHFGITLAVAAEDRSARNSRARKAAKVKRPTKKQAS